MFNHIVFVLLLLAFTLQGCSEDRFDEDREVVIDAVLIDDRPVVLAARKGLGLYFRSASDTTRLIEPDQWDVRLNEWALKTGSLTLENESLSYYVRYAEANGEGCLAYGAVDASTLRLVRSEPCDRSLDWLKSRISSEIVDDSVVANIYFDPVAGQLVNKSRLVAWIDLVSGEVDLTDISGSVPTFYGDGLAYVAAVPPNIGWVVVRSGGRERRVLDVGTHPWESIRGSRNGLFVLHYPSRTRTITYVEDLGGTYVTRGSVRVQQPVVGLSTTWCAGRNVVTYTKVYSTWDLAAYVAYWNGERMVTRRVEEADKLFGPAHPDASTCSMLGVDVEYERSRLVRVDLSTYVEEP